MSATWPNEPADAILITDFPMSGLVGSGWNVSFNSSCFVASDATAPLSPSSIIEHRYPVGFVAGEAPCIHFYTYAGKKKLYIGFWIKISNPWQSHPSGNKMVYIGKDNLSPLQTIFIGMLAGKLWIQLVMPGINNSHLDNSDGDVVGPRNIHPNVNNPTVTLGVWHRIEALLQHSTNTTSQDGIVRWWIDGIQGRESTNVNFSTSSWVQTEVASVWGGVGGTKSELDTFLYDHIHLSSFTSTATDPPAGTAGLPEPTIMIA